MKEFQNSTLLSVRTWILEHLDSIDPNTEICISLSAPGKEITYFEMPLRSFLAGV